MRLQDKFYNNIRRNNIPFWITWEITYKCNHKCKFCYNDEESKPELTYKQVCEALDRLKEAGALHILFTGGEPFIRNDFLDIIKYARQNSFEVSIYSNGSFITKEISDKISALRVSFIGITVHSLKKEVFENITGIPDSFSRVMSAIKFLRQNNIPLRIKTSFLKDNYHEVSRLWNFAERLGYLFHYGYNLIPC